MRIAADLPPAIEGDSLRLKQIFNNLLSNAVKFTRQGHVRLSARCEGSWLLFSVEDSGPGIPPEAQALIFERFRQGNARVSHEHGGTGLGLALSRALAELMGGTLTVRSEPGQGACFTLALPAPPVPAVPPVPPTPPIPPVQAKAPFTVETRTEEAVVP